jgi:hypothetical protein
VAGGGREMQKVVQWNERYGELRAASAPRPPQLSIYI